MKEADLWRIVKQGLSGEQVDLQRIESGQTSRGIFDINALWAGIEIWIELKVEDHPGLSKKFRPEQKAWALRRFNHGGRLWLIHGLSGKRVKDPLRLEIWNVNRHMLEAYSDYEPDAVVTHPVNWNEVRQLLFGNSIKRR